MTYQNMDDTAHLESMGTLVTMTTRHLGFYKRGKFVH